MNHSDVQPESQASWLAFPAPAKLNLFLHVLGRRADGYHLLQTVFRLLDYGDWVWIRPRADTLIRRTKALPGVPEAEDLTIRAARLLQQAAGCVLGAELWVDKRLPMGGGLGGGSSDAATVLLALNHLWQLGWSRSALAELGLQLGADVPVFVMGDNAAAEGVGEKLTALPLAPAWYVVLAPHVHVSTVEVFRDPLLTRDTKSITIAAFRDLATRNDLQAVVTARAPGVQASLEWLKQYGDARMTGSGSCVFLELDKQRDACAIIAALPSQLGGIQVEGFVAQGLSQHPLKCLGQ